MTPPDTSAPAVEAMIARLRPGGITHLLEAADMLAALLARAERAEVELDDARREITSLRLAWSDDVATAQSERDAAREALAKAVSDEREACAQLVERTQRLHPQDIADAIRARSATP